MIAHGAVTVLLSYCGSPWPIYPCILLYTMHLLGLVYNLVRIKISWILSSGAYCCRSLAVWAPEGTESVCSVWLWSQGASACVPVSETAGQALSCQALHCHTGTCQHFQVLWCEVNNFICYTVVSFHWETTTRAAPKVRFKIWNKFVCRGDPKVRSTAFLLTFLAKNVKRKVGDLSFFSTLRENLVCFQGCYIASLL